MLVEHTEYRSKPRAVPRMERWRVELHACESQRVKAAERALSREQRTQEMREQFIPLVKKAGADLRMFRDLGRQTHGIDPRWAKTLNERCQKHVAELVAYSIRTPTTRCHRLATRSWSTRSIGC